MFIFIQNKPPATARGLIISFSCTYQDNQEAPILEPKLQLHQEEALVVYDATLGIGCEYFQPMNKPRWLQQVSI
jgi:hypothetical protein